MRVRRVYVAVVLAGVAAALGGGACSEAANEAADDTPPVATFRTPDLPDGETDRFGRLPRTVGDLRVTRGAAAGYVADQACRKCHEKEYDSYRSMGMARSFYRPDPSRLVESLDEVYEHPATGYRYQLKMRDGKLFVERHCVDDKGRRFAEHAVEVAWIVGSGNHARTYFAQNARGELAELPVTWYREKGLAMSPGYDRLTHPRFERMVEIRCMFCHNAYPEVPVGSDLGHQSHRFPHEMPEGIGCQRCHGPGARHIELAEEPDADDAEIRRRIVNPARFTDRQKEDLCMSCHLQPEAIRSRMMPQSFSRPLYSFVPGADLSEFMTHLDHGDAAERSERFEINHHAYRLRQSRCYVASAGRLTCLTCHDPHRKIPREEQAAYYRSKCAQCHAPADCGGKHTGNAAQSDCISCHMASARPSDVVHVTVTDHLIRRHKPARDLTAPRQEEVAEKRPLEIIPYFPERSGQDPLYPVYAGFGESYYPTPKFVRDWKAAFAATKPHTVVAYVNVSRGLIECADHDGAIGLLNEAVAHFPNDAPLRWTLGQALLQKNQVPAAVAELERARDLDPADPGILGDLADAYRAAGVLGRARDTYVAALRGRPESSKTWQSLGYTLLKLRDYDAALPAFANAIAGNPHDAYSYTASATLLESQGRTAQRFRLLEQGASLLPEIELELIGAKLLATDAPYRDPQGALARATKLVEAQPGNGRAYLHLALAQLLAGAVARAPATIEAARRHGADPASCSLLGVIDAIEQRDRAKLKVAMQRAQSELQRPSAERLRATLVDYLAARGFELR